MKELAIEGGSPAVSHPWPHREWPPHSSDAERAQLASQRDSDINIKGRTGPIAAFEDHFLEFMDQQAKYAISFNSGTSALLAAYMALGIGNGDEVIGPVLTYHAALSPVIVLGGIPVLADIQRDTRCICPADLEKRITEDTAAITVVHQWGHPADMDAILDVAARHALPVVEDCSHAHGSRYKGKLCGTFGDVAIFSLQAKKAVFAGEGGILVTDDEDIHDRATLAGHYRDRSRSEIDNPDYQRYETTGFGLKLRMSPFNAIVAQHSLERFPEIRDGRHTCLNYFTQKLEMIDYIEAPHVDEDADMGAWYGFKPLYHPESLSGLSRERLVEILRAEGVDVRVPSGKRLSTMPLYHVAENPISGERRASSVGENCPIAVQVEQHALSFPTFWRPDPGIHIIDEYIRAFRKVEEWV